MFVFQNPYQIPGTQTRFDEITGRLRAALLLVVGILVLAAGPVSAMTIEFQDVTSAVGLEYMGPSFGASWGDYDHDGRPDLFMNNHATPSTVFRNLHPAGFEDVSLLVEGYLREENPAGYCGCRSDLLPVDGPVKTARGTLSGDVHAGAWADFDNDGDRDLLIQVGAAGGGGHEPNRLLVNNNNESFSEAAQTWGLDQLAARSRTPLWLDWNKDGKLDVIFANLPRWDGQDPTSIFTQADGVFVNDNEYLGFSSDLPNYFSQLMHLSDYDQPLVWVHTSYPFPDRLYDTGTVPFTSVQEELGMPHLNSVMDFLTGDLDGDLETEIFLARHDPPSAVSQTGTNEVRAKIKGLTETERGFRFATDGSVTFTIGPDWKVVEDQIYIGSGGYHPASRTFTLDADDQDAWGAPTMGAETEGVVVYRDTSEMRWYAIIDGAMSLGILATSTEDITDMESLGFTAGVGAKADYLMDRVNGAFQDVGSASGVSDSRFSRSVVAADFDNDMDLDIYIVCSDAGSNHPNALLENDGTGLFTAVPGAGGAEGSTKGIGDSATVVDYNSDGFMDILVTNGAEDPPLNLDGPTQFFQNTGNGNHWLSIELEGVISNPEGIGAVVYVDAGGKRQVRFQGGGMHFYSQNHSRLHFGLANNLLVEQIEIRWPNGLVEQITNVPADQVCRIREGDGILSASGLPEMPAHAQMHPPVPNPFNPRTSISFDLPQQASASLRIYDVSGRLVRTLLDGETLGAGRHAEIWNGKNNQGLQVSAGVYFCRLVSGTFQQTRTVALVK